MTRQKTDRAETLMEAVPLDEFIRRYRADGQEEKDGPTVEEAVTIVRQLLADGSMPHTQFLAAVGECGMTDTTWGEVKHRLRFFFTWKDGTRYCSLSRPADGEAYSCSALPDDPDEIEWLRPRAEPGTPTAGDGAWYLIENLVALDPRAAGLDPLVDDLGPLVKEASAKVRELLERDGFKPAREDEPFSAPLDMPLSAYQALERAVKEMNAEARRRSAQERGPTKQAAGLPQARSFATICAEADEATDWLLSGYLAREYVTLLYAKPKVGKSELTYNLIASSQQGEEFLGQQIKPLRVVYLSEEPPRSIRQKIERLGIDANRITGLCRKDTVRRQFDFASVLRWAKAAAVQSRADLIVIDTLAFWAKLPPEAENDAGTMAEVGNRLADLAAETGCAVLVLMHSKKGNEAGIDALRGSSAMAGASDILVQLRQPHDGLPERELRVQGRDDEIAKPVKVTFREGRYTFVGSLLPHGKSTKKRLIANALPTKDSGEGWKVDRIAKETGLSERYVRELVTELVEEKVAVKEEVKEKRRMVSVYWRDPTVGVFYAPDDGEAT